MQTSNRILDDLARVANGAVSTLAGVKGEIDTLIRQKIEQFIIDADLVPRDDFDAVKIMAAEARLEQERLAKRVTALEKQLKLVVRDKTIPPKRKAVVKTKASTRRKLPAAKSKKAI